MTAQHLPDHHLLQPNRHHGQFGIGLYEGRAELSALRGLCIHHCIHHCRRHAVSSFSGGLRRGF